MIDSAENRVARAIGRAMGWDIPEDMDLARMANDGNPRAREFVRLAMAALAEAVKP